MMDPELISGLFFGGVFLIAVGYLIGWWASDSNWRGVSRERPHVTLSGGKWYSVRQIDERPVHEWPNDNDEITF